MDRESKDERDVAAAHREQAAKMGTFRVGLVTVSDTRTPETDQNGAFLRSELEASGFEVARLRIIPDEPDQVEEALAELVADGVHGVLFNGGTGISQRDTTFDVLSRRLEKELPGFGELFRTLSYEQIGAAAMLSRAAAGVYRGVFVVCMPGSPKAVRLAWERLLRPELRHILGEIRK